MALERKSGILAHPTSFQSKYGIGDLGDATYRFIDFLHKSNQKLWQILPLGPTSFGDSPYQCFSTFAGNHFLISPDILIGENLLSQADLTDIPNFDNYKIDYGNVIKYKNSILRKAYENFKLSNNDNYKKEYKTFVDKSKWLDDYCLFMALKYHFIAEREGTFETPEYKAYKEANKDLLTENQINDNFYGAVWNSWESGIAKRNKSSIAKWTTALSDDIGFHKFVQFEFYRQWKNVKSYANEHSIHIIGDIPIFVAYDSSDVWANSELFFLDKGYNPTQVAGVPPDYFSETGQLWGNPLYDWKAHSKQGYAWWISRISEMLELVDVIRIDHFRAFDEYWSIPYGEQTAINGKWVTGPRHELFLAIKEALGELPIIAEDLGLMTPTVEQLRDDLDLPGMKVLQFAFDASEENDYLPHNFKTSNCVAYSGTHDNDTSVGWYNSTDEENRDHFRRYMNVDGSNPAWDLIRLVWSSSAGYAIVPVQDLFTQDSSCRMNTPGVGAGNWQYRFTLDMLSDDIQSRLAYLTKLFDR